MRSEWRQHRLEEFEPVAVEIRVTKVRWYRCRPVRNGKRLPCKKLKLWILWASIG
jgi:hypothetical protein